uniref:ASD2 domain-containing protein n=1 Tax=Steinernema glaseri TaxID=37863 RepID=A0A1I8ASD7_9BILA
MSMSRKVSILDEERNNIDEELEANEEFKKSTFAVVLEQKPFLVKRIDCHLNQSMQMAALEARLRDQVEKIDQALAGNTDEPEFLSMRRKRLQDQFNDIAFLKSASDKREEDISREVEKALGNDITLMEQWRYYKETLIKLNVEKRQIADRLNVAKSQLKSLENLSI